MSSCLIQLDNFQGLYCAGNVIAGRVICTFNKTKSINGIKLKLKGEESNAWTGSETHYDSLAKRHRTRTIYYSGQNTFLYLDVPLAGVGDVGPGTIEYPFTVQLPTNIPGTYQGHYGGIFFTLNAKVQRSFNSNYTDTIQIIVASLIDFNQIRGLLQLQPVAYSVDKTICCWCCTSGPITMAVHLEKEAFVVGEVANIRVDISNMSNQNIDSVNVKLSMKVTSMVTYPRSDCKYDNEVLAMQSDTGVGAHAERTYNFGLKILETRQLPNFSMSQLFSQRTKLKVTAVIPGVHSNLDVETYVTMGHVPICTSQNQGQYPPNTYPPNLYPPTTYPTIRDGIRSPMSEEAGAGPSAPPTEGGVSAPFKTGIANNGFDMEGSDDPWSTEIPPPTYSEAVPNAEKQ